MLDAVPADDFFEQITGYVGFGARDSELLLEFLPAAQPHFLRISEHFYAAILAHPTAHAAITGGQPQIERLKKTLQEWMHSGLAGPHDHAFYERRARIGRMHVRIRLPQQFMFTAMNLMRLDFRVVALQHHAGDLSTAMPLLDALDRLFDLELAIMLQTFAEDSEARLRTAERLATIGQLAASIGHDLRNPLGVVESSLYILRRQIDPDSRATRHLDKISSQVENCNHIVTDLLELARDRPPKRHRVPIDALVAAAREDLSIPANVEVVTDFAPDVAVSGDPGLLRQVLVNLINNAMLAFEGAPGHVYVSAHELPGDRVRVVVADDGPGFGVEALERAFEPLFTTRAKGTGLGLAMVRNVIERHGGAVRASNRPEGGARLEIELDSGSAHV